MAHENMPQPGQDRRTRAERVRDQVKNLRVEELVQKIRRGYDWEGKGILGPPFNVLGPMAQEAHEARLMGHKTKCTDTRAYHIWERRQATGCKREVALLRCRSLQDQGLLES